MFPVLTVMYVKLTKSEEREAIAEFGNAYTAYAADVPAFIPLLQRFFGPSQTGDYHHGR